MWRRTWLRRAGWAAGRGGPAPRSLRWRWTGWGPVLGTPLGPQPRPSCSSPLYWTSYLKYSSVNPPPDPSITGTAVRVVGCVVYCGALELCLVLNNKSRQGCCNGAEVACSPRFENSAQTRFLWKRTYTLADWQVKGKLLRDCGKLRVKGYVTV